MTIRFSLHTAVRSAVCLLILLLSGCSSLSSRDLLWYQDSMTAAVLTETDSGRSWRITLSGQEFTAELLAPPSVAGIRFTAGTEAYAEAGEVRIPIGEVMLTGARRAKGCLTLSPDALTGLEPCSDGGVLADFSTSDARYTLCLGEDGLPRWITVQDSIGNCRYNFTAEVTP